MDLRHLRAFIAVAEESSFRKASEVLFVAQPALSRTIQSLERDIGVKLFERTTRAVTLTEPGRYLLDHARTVLKRLDDIVEGTRRVDLGERGELFVGFNDFTISDKLPAIVHRFRSRFPDIAVNLASEPSMQMMEQVRDGRLDIGFLSGLEPGPGLDSAVIRREEFVCVMPIGHPLSKRKTLRLQDIANEDFVVGYAGWEIFLNAVTAYCLSAGFEPNVVQRAIHSDGIINLVAAGVGITIYVDRHGLHLRDDVAVKPLKNPQPRFESLAVWTRSPRAKSMKYFLEVLHEELADGASRR